MFTHVCAGVRTYGETQFTKTVHMNYRNNGELKREIKFDLKTLQKSYYLSKVISNRTDAILDNVINKVYKGKTCDVFFCSC